MLKSPMDSLDAVIDGFKLDRGAIHGYFVDLDEREAIQAEDIEATENLRAFLVELWRPFDSEKNKTAYQIFSAMRDAYIAEFSRLLRRGSDKPGVHAAWLLLVYGTEEQADAFMMGSEENRTRLLRKIINDCGMQSATKAWVELS